MEAEWSTKAWYWFIQSHPELRIPCTQKWQRMFSKR